MLSLVEPLGTTITIGGEEWTIDLSFDNVLRWYILLDDEEVDDAQKVYLAFNAFVGEGTNVSADQMVAVVSEISKYVQQTVYGDNADEPSVDLNGDPVKQERFFSYEKDADAIFASFMADYHVDLIAQQGKLRWEKFKAMLDGLSETTQLRRIIAIRQRDTAGLEGAELANLLEAQEYYRLDDQDTQASLDNQMGQMFGMLAERAKED
ncbi:Gp15 family bacteriophage protein [Lactiplantibacillus plantarum]|uniref:Gp15 family bacteriophage protein n=1 Tax=Lactiplantibacillus plantarum TaxID=1590 RepID=UPI0039659208